MQRWVKYVLNVDMDVSRLSIRHEEWAVCGFAQTVTLELTQLQKKRRNLIVGGKRHETRNLRT
jgi:hypothetical protein